MALAAMPPSAIGVEDCAGQLTISEAGGCACSLLSEAADWNAPEWDLLPRVREPLADTILALAKRWPAGFTFQAVWISDPVRYERVVSADDLAELVRRNQLANWTRYVVRPRPAV